MPHEMRGAVYRRVSPSGDSFRDPELHHQSAGGEVGGWGKGEVHDLPDIVPYFIEKTETTSQTRVHFPSGHQCLSGLLGITKVFYWVGRKVHLGLFSVTFYGKTQMNFLANPIHVDIYIYI